MIIRMVIATSTTCHMFYREADGRKPGDAINAARARGERQSVYHEAYAPLEEPDEIGRPRVRRVWKRLYL